MLIYGVANNTYHKNENIGWSVPNYWDAVALALIVAIFAVLGWTAMQMATPYNVGQAIPISLSPRSLPVYAMRTVLRMFIALFCSLIFTFVFGAVAAKNKKAERIIIPLIDVLQSIPVLSFLSISVAGFILLFRGSLLGPECAAIFAIFTSQVWNMTLSFYQSVKSVPKDLREVTAIYQLSSWQKFWRLEVPYAMPGLLWNMMMSMSGSWFFVVASEAISVANQHINLPGIGSYIAVAIAHADKTAIYYAIGAMLIVILLYDQLLFRPLVQWSEKFKFDEVLDERISRSWVVNLFQRTRVLRQVSVLFYLLFDKFVNINYLLKRHSSFFQHHLRGRQDPGADKKKNLKYFFVKWKIIPLLGDLIVFALFVMLLFYLWHFLVDFVTWHDVARTFVLGSVTALRVLVLIFLCSLIWVPVGVWIGFRPRLTEFIQPIIQFLAAFPANLVFPIVALWIVKYKLDVNIWTSPLMVLGTQWYILFNVIAGASAIPEEVRLVSKNLGVKGFVKWRRLILPAIMPFFVTGAITAAGGAWNASILAEAINWGNIKLNAVGLGAYITHYTRVGNFPHVILGTAVMCLFVLVINRILWRPLYNLAIERFKVN
ncbi:MAG: ABC transporter permease subunit [Gammaproteobacteria bacterium]|nr:ABC transporter permease subunit [Gammaproteobacteria bacterium]